jgi:hypothetical protein
MADRVRATVDSQLRERECDETNNELTVDVVTPQPQAELGLRLVPRPACGSASAPTVATELCNAGAVAAEEIVVTYYAGNPAQGGSALHEETFHGPLEAGACDSRDVYVSPFPSCTEVRIYATVDAANTIPECNDGNNTTSDDDLTVCCIE